MPEFEGEIAFRGPVWCVFHLSKNTPSGEGSQHLETMQLHTMCCVMAYSLWSNETVSKHCSFTAQTDVLTFFFQLFFCFVLFYTCIADDSHSFSLILSLLCSVVLMSFCTFLMFYLFIVNLAIKVEKTEQELRTNINKFNRNSLKHTETQEKNPLPDSSGL